MKMQHDSRLRMQLQTGYLRMQIGLSTGKVIYHRDYKEIFNIFAKPSMNSRILNHAWNYVIQVIKYKFHLKED